MAFNPFFDDDPNGASQDDIAQRQQMGQSLLSQSQQPAAYWTQGMANVANALLGGFEMGRARRDQRQNDDYSRSIANALLSGDGAFGGAGTDVSRPVTNPYAGSPQTLSAGGYDGSAGNPFGDTDAGASPVVQALMQSGQGSAAPAAKQGALDLISQNLLDHMRQAESGGNNNAVNPRSSATGSFQFTDPTWTGLMHQHPELGLTADGRTNPQQSEAAAKQLATDNIAYLLAHGVQNPTEGDVYLAHFAGPAAAARAASADPSSPVASILSQQQIAANPNVQGMTAGGLRDWAAGKMGGQAAAAPGISGLAPAGLPQQPMPAQQFGQFGIGASMPSMGALAAVLSDPRVNEQTRSLAGLLMGNQLQMGLLAQQEQLRQADPLYQSEINERNMRAQALQQRMNAPSNPGMTTEQQNLAWRAQQAGLQPGTPGWQQFMASNGQQQKPDVQPTFLTPEQIKAAGLDPTRVYAASANGQPPKDMGDNEETKTANRIKTLQAAKSATDDALASIDRVAAMSSDLNYNGSFAHGALGHYYSEINPASNASAMRNEIASLKAKLSYQTLAGMKQSGIGGLGQISDGDMILLGNASGALNPDTDNATMQRQLAVIRQKVSDAYNNSLTAGDRDLLQKQKKSPTVTHW